MRAESPAAAAAAAADTIPSMMVGGQPFYSPDGEDARGNTYFRPFNPETGTFSRLPHVSRLGDGSMHVSDSDRGKLTTVAVDGAGAAIGKLSRGKTLKSVGDVDATGRMLHGRGNDTNKLVQGATQPPGTGEPLSPRTVEHLADNGGHRLAGAVISGAAPVALTPVLRAAAATFAAPFVPVAAAAAAAAPVASAAAPSRAAAAPPLARPASGNASASGGAGRGGGAGAGRGGGGAGGSAGRGGGGAGRGGATG